MAALDPVLASKIPARDIHTLSFLLAYLEEKQWLPQVQVRSGHDRR